MFTPEDLLRDEKEHLEQTHQLQQLYPHSRADQQSLLRIRTRLVERRSAMFAPEATGEKLQVEEMLEEQADLEKWDVQTEISASFSPELFQEKRAQHPRRPPIWVRTLAAVLLVGVLLGSFLTVLEVRKAGQQGRPPLTPPATPTAIPTQPPLVNGASAYLRDVTSGRVLLDFKSHLHVPMEGTSRIMTALLVIEHLRLDDMVAIQQSELDEVPRGTSIAYLHANDQMSIIRLLYALLLPSGSDAAVVLAHTVSGTTASFVP